MIHGLRRCCLVAVAVTVSTALVAKHIDGNEQVIGPSYGTVPIQSLELRALGLTASVEMSRQQGPGYVAVRLVITGIGAVPADRRLTFRFATHPNGESPPGNRLIVDVPVMIPQGAKTMRITRYFPKWSIGHCTDMTIYQEGRLLEDSLTQFGSPQNLKPMQIQIRANNWGGTAAINLPTSGLAREVFEDWLIVSDQDDVDLESMPNVRDIWSGAASDSLLSTTPVSLGIIENDVRNYHAVGQSKLPTDWRGYQTYDVVVMNSRAHARLAESPTIINPLREWILQGGTAIVYDAESIREVIENWRFSVVPSASGRKSLIEFAANRDQTAIALKKRAEQMIVLLKQGNAVTIEEKQDAAAQFGTLGFNELPDPPNLPDLSDQEASIDFYKVILRKSNERISDRSSDVIDQIKVHVAGAGLLLTLGEDANQPNRSGASPLHWAFAKRLVRNRCSPMLRQGTEPIRGHGRFRDWTIAGVLQPPVYVFMGIVSLFVILVGPVAFWQTTKYGRSHLMFAVAPLLALITTLAMLGYGVVADGFSTQVRVRQLTWVDGYSGDAAERVRATYFAGIRPSDGLQFPGNATVNRQAEPSNISWSESNQLPPMALGKITVRDDAQIFGSSFLPSRDQRQFIVHTPRTGIGNLQLHSPSSDKESPKITSTFGFELRDLILCDDEGRYWLVEQLNGGGTETCVGLDAKAASRRLGDLYNEHRPVSVASNQKSSSRNQTDSFNVLNAITQQLGIRPKYATGVFEEWLSGHLQITGELPKQYFVAISDVSDDAVAVEGSEIVDSVRYVFGTVRSFNTATKDP